MFILLNTMTLLFKKIKPSPQKFHMLHTSILCTHLYWTLSIKYCNNMNIAAWKMSSLHSQKSSSALIRYATSSWFIQTKDVLGLWVSQCLHTLHGLKDTVLCLNSLCSSVISPPLLELFEYSLLREFTRYSDEGICSVLSIWQQKIDK